MDQLFDLSLMFISPSQDAPASVIANFSLFSNPISLSQTGNLLVNPLTKEERELLTWYLEEYCKWPFEGFLERGRQVEALLPQLGKRLYEAVFPDIEIRDKFQIWRTQSGGRCQISVISDLPEILSLPWELLHDGHDFLALSPNNSVSIVRRLTQGESTGQVLPFELPLRILLVTARPTDVGFIDPRLIAHELLDEMQGQINAGYIELEFLRPPTLSALRERLKDDKQPIHILHFDGHGTFHERQGMLAFEDNIGKCKWATGEEVAQELRSKGIRLVVLNACQSAVSAGDNVFSSVATQLLQGGIDAVIAMSASVLVASATRYTEMFYRALAGGMPIPLAQDQARQALSKDLRRHSLHRRSGEESKPIELHDWWLPHLYQQRSLVLKPSNQVFSVGKQRRTSDSDLPNSVSLPPHDAFFGRAYDMLFLERMLRRGWLVMVHGLAGIGKTAFVCETAKWLTQTDMYDGACYVSFESGGDVSLLLRTLTSYLCIYDNHDSNNVAGLPEPLNLILKQKRMLLIVDHLESVLANGTVPMNSALLTQLWDVLLALRDMGVGVVLASQNIDFADERLSIGNRVIKRELKGLYPEDAYTFAAYMLAKLKIDHIQAPYEEIHDLLIQLNYHPLAIQHVFHALQKHSLAEIRANFVALLPEFGVDTETGRNRSLLSSLDYSLQRLAEKHRKLLFHLAPFEDGVMETDLMSITKISEDEWTEMRSSLEQVGLLTAEPVHQRFYHRHTGTPIPFLRFHPVLTAFLRSQPNGNNASLRDTYIAWYMYGLGKYMELDSTKPEPVRAIVRRELPNMRRVVRLLLETDRQEATILMAIKLSKFMNILGMKREYDQLQHQLEEIMKDRSLDVSGTLTEVEVEHEFALGQREFEKGDLQTAHMRFTTLLARIEAQPQGSLLGSGSLSHANTLAFLARCLMTSQRYTEAEDMLHRALAIVEQHPDSESFKSLRRLLLADHGNVLLLLGQYQQARTVFEEALRAVKQAGEVSRQADTLMQLGTLAFQEMDYVEARLRYTMARELYHNLGELLKEAGIWNQLGRIAERHNQWGEAERCYRESLILREQLGNGGEIAFAYEQLARVSGEAGRALEAENWWKQALKLDEQFQANTPSHADHLTQLANLIVEEVKGKHALVDRLTEAQIYAEQALVIKETLGTPKIWTTLNVLQRIAYLQGRNEAACDYRHRTNESFANFAGNRDLIDRLLGPHITSIVEAARGNTQKRIEVEAELPNLQTQLPGLDENNKPITDAIHRIWAGERDWHLLTEDLDAASALLVMQILETLAKVTRTGDLEVHESKPQQGKVIPEIALEASESEGHSAVEAAVYYLHTQREEAIIRKYGALLYAVAAVASGDITYKDKVATVLVDLETQGILLKEPVQRIWAGERNLATLIVGLDRSSMILVRRVLEIIEEK